MSDDSDTVTLNVKGLEKLAKALRGRMPTARVGILGDKTSRQGDGPTNAQVGAAHEFGTSKLPRRSFLRMPLSQNLENYLDKAGAFDENTFKKVIAEGSIKEWVRKVGIAGEAIVAEAFATGGFGQWKPSDMSRKETKQTLVETQQLRNSITSDVVE